MSLNDTVSAHRIHIGFFGLRNAGKSSVVNAVTGQNLSIVSDVRGTTTDPVKKAMELLPLGPVVIVDTPGIDDEGSLGAQRIERAKQALGYTDIAVLVADAARGLQKQDSELLSLFQARGIPYVIAFNKADLLSSPPPETEHALYLSAKTGENVFALKEKLGRLCRDVNAPRRPIGDLLAPGDTAVLVVPIDSAAPKGRLILPQQQVLRDILDAGAMALVARDEELPQALARLAAPPSLVITDSQVFPKVASAVPPAVPLTSFSILMMRSKGGLHTAVRGAAQLAKLRDGDTVLIAEGCTHHRQCDDIGTVKLPAWIRGYTKADVRFAFTSGGDFPEDLSPYALALHCGGCMLNERELQTRMARAQEAGLPFTNYGVAIAQMHGILRRSLSLFPDLLAELNS